MLSKKPRLLRAARSHPEENASAGGDEQLQDQLVQYVQSSMRKQRLIEDVNKLVQEEADNLRTRYDDAKKDVERNERLMLDRNNLEYNSRQADVNKAADDFEEILRESRAEMENRKRDFEAWEAKVEKSRNQGTFFKGLYGHKREKSRQSGGGGVAASSSGGGMTEDRESGRSKGEPPDLVLMYNETTRSMRSVQMFYIICFGVLLAVNGFTIFQDLSDEKPNYAIDAFLVACEATLGYIIWKMNVWIADSQRSSS